MNGVLSISVRRQWTSKSRSWKRWLFPIYALTVIFSELISYCYLILEDVDAESKIMQYIFAILTGIALFLLLKEVSNKLLMSTWKVLGVLILVPVLYFTTSAFYDTPPENYTSYILRYCSICISACIVGIYMAYHPCQYEIDRLLPFFVIPIGIILGSVCMDSIANMKYIKSESGLNYQNVAYGMAELYAYSCYYVFFSKAAKEHRYLRLSMFAMIFYFAAFCFVAGGRGAVVFLCFISVIIIWLLYKQLKINKILFVLSLLFCVLVFIGVSSYFDIWNTVGFARIAERLDDASSRVGIYDKSIEVFLDSYGLGCGLGSIWWTVGIYSHNIFLDLLAEIGIIGCILVCSVFFFMLKKMFNLVSRDKSYLFILLCFLKTIIVTIFSTYWISSYQIWLLFGFVFSLNSFKYKFT